MKKTRRCYDRKFRISTVAELESDKLIKPRSRKGYYFRYVSTVMAETERDIIVDTISIIGKYPILIITGCHTMTKEEMQNLSIARSSFEMVGKKGFVSR